MIWHPLTWAFWTAAATGFVLFGLAFVRAMDIYLQWAPDRADIHQLRREHSAERISLLATGAWVVLTAAILIGILGITIGWHPVVPGAMCGTGVLQSMGSNAYRAMIFWGLGLTLLYAWRVVDRLNQSHPGWTATHSAARLLIAAAPFIALAMYTSWQALMHVDTVPAVSCCAAVYDRVLASPAETRLAKQLMPAVFWGHIAGGLVLAVLLGPGGRTVGRLPGAVIAATALAWSLCASMAVKYVWSAYYYQVLSHPCPWCLFLWDSCAIGFLMYGCIAVVAMESVAFWSADHIYRRHSQLAAAANTRMRWSARAMIGSLIGFALITVGPAVHWRYANGAWLDVFH